MRLLFTTFFLAFGFNFAIGQILTTIPAVPPQNDSLEIFYDLSSGNAALVGQSPIYAYTGLITDQSVDLSDWRYIKATWGQNDPALLMQHEGGNVYSLKFHTRDFYGIPQNEQIEKFAFLFRNFDASVVGRNSDGSDIFVNVGTPNVQIEPLPQGIVDGINYTSSTSVTLSLFAPGKSHVSVIGDFNGWNPGTNDLMKRTPDGNRFWIEITGLTPGQEHLFQYLVEDELRISDPYSEKILTEEDLQISPTTYPGLVAYPTGMTNGSVTVIQTDQSAYNWQNSNFNKPDQKDLVIYELLIRDFVHNHDYKTLIDSLDHISRLGVNAIELMPIMEFEGNDSWGYNPSHFLAPDKYYGPATELKRFIDEAHGRGIAVILDIALNHAYSQCPLVQLYWDSTAQQPTADNPWLNETPRHPFNVGFDFNHESAATKLFVDRVVSHWIEEYQIDGYRFDLSKGFTQNFTGNDVGAWGQYDASRVALLKRMADVVWAADPQSYVILEHFSDNSEEIELSNYGMLIWGNGNEHYTEASMGFLPGSNFAYSVSWKARSWSSAKLIGYMESHDEERMMYKNKSFGNSFGAYDIQDFETGLERSALAAAFFFTLPGPKMLWQFGELGYDVSINHQGCRTCPKPIRWTYASNPDRKRLYKIYAALIQLKTDYPAFQSDDFWHFLDGAGKSIHINHPSMDVTVVGNFDTRSQEVIPNFEHDGKWYEYFSGDSLLVTNTMDPLPMAPGEFRIYTTNRLPKPEISVPTSSQSYESNVMSISLTPNPAQDRVLLRIPGNESDEKIVELVDVQGAIVQNWQLEGYKKSILLSLDRASIKAGVYFIRIKGNRTAISEKLVIQ